MENGKVIFDEIADFYDETRKEITPNEINAMVSAMDSCRTVLDVGVGTGRIAKPLQDKGFMVTGIDLSVKMMEKARLKGVNNLVIGNATNLPFLDKSFDALVSVHVFHLLDQRERMMREAARVTKHVILSLIRESDSQKSVQAQDRKLAWTVYTEMREKYGYPVDPSLKNSRRYNEHTVLEDFPPYGKILVNETEHHTDPLNFSRRFRRSSRYVKLSSEIPEKIHSEILEEVDSRLAQMALPSTITRVKEYLCVWRPEDLVRITDQRSM